jgi:predicted transcriptional regulator
MTRRTQLIDYRVDRWLNKVSNEAMYGVSVKVAGHHGWIRVAENGNAVIKDFESEAISYIAKMKSERDADGYTRAAA